MNRPRFLYGFIFSLLILLSGCTAEQRLAKSFVKMEKPHPFLVMRPDYVFKYNLKEFEVPGIDSLDGAVKDSTLLASSMFLKELSDSLLINVFVTKFEKTLSEAGLTVVCENYMDSLMAGGLSASVIHIAQISLEEYIHPYTSEEQVYDEIIVIDSIDLNAINYNIWLELSRMNGEGRNQLLFASDYLLDEVDGTLKQNLLNGEFRFDFTIDTITVQDIYQYAGRFGEITASLFYDYLMNRYIREYLPEDYPYEVQYYHYDYRRRLTYPVGPDQRILEMEP